MESFANRVDKVFGSLQVTSCSWRLSPEKQRLHVKKQHAAEVEEQEGEEEEEEDDEEDGCRISKRPPSQFSFDNMEVEEDLEEEGRTMRQMVGLDTTLDHEDEEDEFDKAAFGLDGSEEDRLYMKGVKEADRKLNVSRSLPLSFYDLKKLRRDPRANHSAARARLEEDAKEAAAAAISTDMASMRTTEDAEASNQYIRDVNENVAGVKRSSEDMPAAALEAPPANSSKDTVKPPKRVRFALDLQEPGDLKPHSHKEFMRHKPNSVYRPKVPDHVRNPSKYTHYTLDWSVEDNDNSNFEAFRACDEALQQKVEEDPFLEERVNKIQFVHKHERTSSNNQKGSMEQANRSAMAISKTMCVEHMESESESVEVLHDDEAMDLKPEDSTSGFHMVRGKSAGRIVKNFRLRRESDDTMDT